MPPTPPFVRLRHMWGAKPLTFLKAFPGTRGWPDRKTSKMHRKNPGQLAFRYPGCDCRLRGCALQSADVYLEVGAGPRPLDRLGGGLPPPSSLPLPPSPKFRSLMQVASGASPKTHRKLLIHMGSYAWRAGDWQVCITPPLEKCKTSPGSWVDGRADFKLEIFP